MNNYQISFNDEELHILKLLSDKSDIEKITILESSKVDCDDEIHKETLANLMLKLSKEKYGINRFS